MQRPEIRIIQNQEEQIQPANIDSWEAEQLLRKYGHQPQQFSTREEPQQPIDNGLTFEQMVAQQESKLKEEVISASLLMYIAVSCNSEKGVLGLSLC